MPELYVTEPNMISIDELRQLVPDKCTITAGQTDFAAGFSSDAEALIVRSATTVTPEFLSHFPQVKAVVRVGTGLDNVDVEYCKAHDIHVYNAPGANADAVAEYVTAMILHANRRLHRLTSARVAAWQRKDFMGVTVADQTVGIVGFGNIGKLLRAKLAGLGCSEFLAYDPYLTEEQVEQAGARKVDLETLLKEADVVSLHMPLTDETRHMIAAEQLEMMKPGAVLINAARGGIVDEQAVLDHLAHTDMVFVEDTVENEPTVDPRLLEHENVIISPHIASLTTAADRAMLQVAVENYLRGESLV